MVVTGLVGVLSAMHERERERTTAVKPGALREACLRGCLRRRLRQSEAEALEAGGPLRLPRLC